MSVSARAAEPTTPNQRAVNLLFIMTDQQRWDAMSCYGNTVIKTPNFDQLAREGARFTSFYSACPVCTPARTAMLTGHDIYANQVLSNNDATKTDAPPFPSFDQILLRNGYAGEYHGKYHSPYRLAVDYTQPVRWLNGKQAPPGSKALVSESEAYGEFVRAHAASRTVQPGQLSAGKDGNYTPIPLDINFGKTNPTKAAQDTMYGRLEIPAEFSRTAFTAKEGIAALERLKDKPFTLTISIDPPHPPMIVSEPYYSLYPPAQIPLPASLNDPRTDSPYGPKFRAGERSYQNPENVRQMSSIYYGMISEVDDWVGKILKRLDELGLADHTLVIFTSDHGEMLGDHGLHSKMVFYEGSAHVPLLMRLPGVIPAGTVVRTPASQLDMFATILEYLNQPAHPSAGQSLRPFIEGKADGKGRCIVSEWPSSSLPGFMVFDGRWKLLFGRTKAATSLDALYDLQTDPEEVKNLLGSNSVREQNLAEASRMKELLVQWLERVNSPWLEPVKSRPISNALGRGP